MTKEQIEIEETNIRRENDIKILGFTNKLFSEEEKILMAKFGCKPEFIDVISSLVNKKAIQLNQEDDAGRYIHLQGLYGSYASVLSQEGRDSRNIKREARRCEALLLREIGYKKIKIIINEYVKNVCEECKKEGNKEYPINDLIRILSEQDEINMCIYCCCWFKNNEE